MTRNLLSVDAMILLIRSVMPTGNHVDQQERIIANFTSALLTILETVNERWTPIEFCEYVDNKVFVAQLQCGDRGYGMLRTLTRFLNDDIDATKERAYRKVIEPVAQPKRD